MRNLALDSLTSSIQKEESKYAFRRKFSLYTRVFIVSLKSDSKMKM